MPTVVIGGSQQGAAPCVTPAGAGEVKTPSKPQEASVASRRSYRQLKPHPGSAGDDVAAHQLGRIHAATIDIVAEGGYRALTVEAIARAAGVSKPTFYRHFAGKEECFLATYDLIVREMTRGVLAAQGSTGEWRQRLGSGFAAFVGEVADRPKAARLALVDIYLDRPAAMERVEHTAGLLGTLIGRTFALADDGVEVPPQLHRAIVGASAALARARLLARATEQLRREAEELTAWTLALRDPAATEAFAVPTLPGIPSRVRAADRPPPCPAQEPRSQREAILRVAAEISATEGHDAVTARRIAKALGLRRSTVTPRMPSREECLLAALDEHGGQAFAEARAAFSAHTGWPTAMRAALEALCSRLEADPALARMALEEVFESGLAPTVWRSRKMRSLAALLRVSAPPGQRPTRLQAEASVAGAWAVLAVARREGRAELRSVAPGLAYIVLAPVIGAPTAVAAIRGRQTPRDGEHAETEARFRAAAAVSRRGLGAGEMEPVPGC